MKEVLNYLNPQVNGFLATINEGFPDVRPFQLQFEENGRFIFCTHSTKNVYHQLVSYPQVAFSVAAEDGTMIRLYGEVKFSEDLTLKQKVLDQQEKLKGIFKEATNPIFKVFYIDHGKVTMINKKLNRLLREIQF